MSLYRCSGKYLLLAGALLVIATPAISNEPSAPTADAAPEMDTLVSAEWLSRNLDDPDLVVLDCTVTIEPDEAGGIRTVNGRAGFEAGHIPTAGFADLMGELAAADSPLEYALPPPEQFVAAMEKLGVSDDSRVVLYDANYSVWAARVWWMLRWIGFDRAALLDGGLEAWKAAGGEVATEPVTPTATTLTINLRPELIADQAEVRAAIEDDSVHIIDSLPEPHDRGERAMYDRPGQIRSALSVPVMSPSTAPR